MRFLAADLKEGRARLNSPSCELGRQRGKPPDHSAPNVDHVCLQVQPWDTDAIRTHLQQHEVEAGDVVPRYGALGMGPSLYFSDPEGNIIELKGSP